MTQLKQLVTKQVDKSLATSISVCFVGGGGGSIVEADFGLHWLALLPSGLSQMSASHPYKIQPLPAPLLDFFIFSDLSQEPLFIKALPPAPCVLWHLNEGTLALGMGMAF